MILDNLVEIKKLDKSNMLGSIEALADQCRETWNDLKGLSVSRNYSTVKNIVVAGMGGSAIGAHIIDSIFFNELKVPLEIVNNYYLPKYVNKDTLVILASYSGNTEEIVSCSVEAQKTNAKIMVFASGKNLAELLKKKKLSGYIPNPKNNPCGSPRMGLGYSLFGLMILLGKAGLINFGEKEATRAIKIVEKYNKLYSVSSDLAVNSAKLLAEKMANKIPFYFAGGHLAGNIHTASNQLNENAKVFAGWFLLPEINHHLMEGLVFPKASKKDLFFIFIQTWADDLKIKKRFTLTQEVAQKAGIESSMHHLAEKKVLDQAFEMLVLGSYASFYLAMLNKIDPTPIPVVDWFKSKI